MLNLDTVSIDWLTVYTAQLFLFFPVELCIIKLVAHIIHYAHDLIFLYPPQFSYIFVLTSLGPN